jgi:pyroglutamyl-peptidase
MHRVLITAFEPYDRWKQNASWLSLVELTSRLPDYPRVVTRLYPVDFQRVRERLVDDLAANFDVALHLGQAPGSGRIQLEAVGLNVGGSSTQSPEEFGPLEPHGPLAYRSNLPLASWAQLLRDSRIPATVSYHAGTYLCNAVLYLSLHLAQARGLKTRSAFIHLPLAPQQVTGERADLPSMPPQLTAEAVRLILTTLIPAPVA